MKAVQTLTALHNFTDCGDDEMVAALLARVVDIDAFRDILSALRDAVDVEIARRQPTEAEKAELTIEQRVNRLFEE